MGAGTPDIGPGFLKFMVAIVMKRKCPKCGELSAFRTSLIERLWTDWYCILCGHSWTETKKAHR